MAISKEVEMSKKENRTEVISFRVPQTVKNKLDKKRLNVAEALNNHVQTLSEVDYCPVCGSCVDKHSVKSK